MKLHRQVYFVGFTCEKQKYHKSSKYLTSGLNRNYLKHIWESDALLSNTNWVNIFNNTQKQMLEQILKKKFAHLKNAGWDNSGFIVVCMKNTVINSRINFHLFTTISPLLLHPVWRSEGVTLHHSNCFTWDIYIVVKMSNNQADP